MTDSDGVPNADRLLPYLSGELGVGIDDIEVLNDGLNLVLGVATERDGAGYVLRRPNKLRHTPLFTDLRTEYRVLQRLRTTPVPAPEPVTFCADTSVLGDPFYVMTRLEGDPVPLGDGLPPRFRSPSARESVATGLVDALAAIHSVDVAPFADVCDHHTPAEQVEHALDRLDVATSVTGQAVPTLREVGNRLLHNAPSTTSETLVHGDFRPGNVLFAGSDRPAITGVLDWETAMLGDPRTELGYLLLRWRDKGDATPSLNRIAARNASEQALRDLRETNEEGLAPFTAEPGSPSRRDLVSRYEDAAGIAFDDDRFFRAHAAFMLGVVWADLHRDRVAAGLDSDWEPYVEYMALLGERIVEGDLRL